MKQTKNLVTSGMCVALAIVLPMAFHMIPDAGKVFLPMHIPVLLCGLLCGPENTLEFTAGESLLVPAGTGKVSLRGDCTVIQTTVPGQA